MDNLIDEHAVCYAHELLDRCDKLERLSYESAMTGLVDTAGKLKLHPLGRLSTDNVDHEYRKQVDRLADHLLVPKYAYSTRSRRSGPGGMIAVRH
jgi:hypothetical protein